MRCSDTDQQPVDNRQSQGEAERDREALSRLTGDVDGSAQSLDASPDYVHAYAPSGYVGDLPGGRETGGQNEGEDLGLGKPGCGVDQALFDGAGAHGLHIQTPSVVTYANEYVGAGVAG